MVRALDDVSLEVGSNEFVVLLGPSGCGKTTLLRTIAGLENVDSGEIHLGDERLDTAPPFRRAVNTVFQSYALFGFLTVERNIAFGLEMKKLPKSEIRARVTEMLDLVELSGYGKRTPDQLSGGQQQRVALARALAKRPQVLLLDEPLGALDLKLRRQMQTELKRIQRSTGIAFVFVTHDQEEALALGAEEIDRAIMREGPETVAAVFLEPVQNSGGCYVPPDGYFQRVREICDTHGILLVSDEVICGFGRLGHIFGADRFGYQPDMITMAKGLTSGYAPLGGVMISDRIAEPFAAAKRDFNHGFTFGGHPAAAAVALANLDIIEGEDLPGRVRSHAAHFRARLSTLCDLPVVADLRGDGYFLALEIAMGGPSDPDGAKAQAVAVSKHLTEGMYRLGLTCRAAARGSEPVIQLSPPLIAGPEQFDEIVDAMRVALIDAMGEFAA